MQITFEEQRAELRRGLFIKEGLVYLNVAAMGPVLPAAFEEALRTWKDLEENPSLHGYEYLQERMEDVRKKAAHFVGCGQKDMVITHSTTDGMNAVAQGLKLKEGDLILTTNQEHPGGRMCWEYLKQEHKVQIETIMLSPAKYDWKADVLESIVEEFRKKIDRKPRVISVSHVTPYTGLKMPIQRIVKLGWPDECVFLVDGAQAVGAIDVNVKKLGCHAYATCGHKWLMGPKGTGLLYLNEDKVAESYIKSLCPQEKHTVYNHATGVRDIPAILGLGAALDCFDRYFMSEVQNYLMFLRKSLHEGLSELESDGLLTIISPPPDNPLESPILTFTLPSEINNERLATILLHKYRFVVKVVPEDITSSLKDEELTLLPYKKKYAIQTNVGNGIRISPHIYNTDDEIKRLIEVIKKELPELKKKE
jgi:Selenocysteine lyase